MPAFLQLGFHHVLIHLSQYSLITYYMPGTMQDAEERKTVKLPPAFEELWSGVQGRCPELITAQRDK